MSLVSVENSQASGPTVAIALGGGGARGLSHIHVIEVLDELGIPKGFEAMTEEDAEFMIDLMDTLLA